MVRFGIEARVGAFVLAALVVGVGFVLALGDFSLTSGVTVHADYAFTSGLQVGAPVMLSGIRVGKVSDLSLLGTNSEPPAATTRPRIGQRRSPLVRADLEIDTQAAHLFSRDAQLHIGTQGLIGEAYVEVTPGTGESLPANEALRGVDAPRLHVMTLQLSALLDATGALVGDGAADGADLGAVGDALASLVSNVDGLLGERRAELGQAITDMAGAAAELRALLSEIRAALDQGRAVQALVDDSGAVAANLRGQLPELLDRTKASLVALEGLTTKADRAVDPEALAAIITDVRHATERLDRITREAEAVMRTVSRGEGTIGGLVQDPQIYDDLKELLRDLKKNPWKFLWRD